MTRLSKTMIGLLMSTGIAYAVPAEAQDFTLTKSVPSACPEPGCGTGTFTLNNNTNTGSDGLFYVNELVVSGLGATAGTTLSGWSPEAFFGVDDPLDCESGTGFSVFSGFCYQLTDTSTGEPIGPGMSTDAFTFDATYTDPALPETFYVLFTDAAGAAFACSGTTGGGCDAPISEQVPEPATMGLFLVSLIGLATTLRRRQA